MLATALPPVLAAPVSVPAPSTAPSGGNGSGPESFARMLDAADAGQQSPDTKPGQKAAAEKKSADKPAATRLDAAAPAIDVATVGPEPAQADGEAAEGGTASIAVEATVDQGLLTSPSQATDAAALLAGLAALPRPLTAEAAATDSAARGAQPAVRRARDATDAVDTEVSLRPAAQAVDPSGAAPRPNGGAATGSGGAETGHGRDPLPTLIQQVRTEADPPDHGSSTGPLRMQAVAAPGAETSPSVDSLTPGAAGLSVAAGPNTPSTGATQTLTPARLSASPGSPEFAGQLGAQLTTFVREGVHHARLELHPIELGPVTVQITIDGTQARVNLAAEHAATRQALEQAMPALAGSLREAGLTLSGGGVFEQPREPQPDGGAATAGGRDSSQRRGAGDERPGSPADRDAAALAAAPLRRRGVVDLVA